MEPTSFSTKAAREAIGGRGEACDGAQGPSQPFY